MEIKISEEVLIAFEERRDILSLEEIYNFILEKYPNILGEGKQYKDKSSFTAGVRAFIERNSSDSEVYSGRNDLFYSVLGKGKGLWGLRKFENEVNGISVLPNERESLRTIRLTQSKFRNELLKAFQYQCPITNISIPSLLIASHIKPWNISNDSEKVNINNGILLSVHMDAMFDKGLIGFTPRGEIVYSSNEVRNLVSNNFKNLNDCIDDRYLTEERKEFFKWHLDYYNLKD